MALGVTDDKNYRGIANSIRQIIGSQTEQWTPGQMVGATRKLTIEKVIAVFIDPFETIPTGAFIRFVDDTHGNTTYKPITTETAYFRAFTRYSLAEPVTIHAQIYIDNVVLKDKEFTISYESAQNVYIADFRSEEPEPEPDPLPDGYTAVPSVKVGSANKGGIVGTFITSIPIANVYKIELIAKEEKTPTTNQVSYPITLKYGTTNAVRLQFNATSGTYHTPTFGIGSQTISTGTYTFDFDLFRKYELYMVKASSALLCDGVICRTSGTAYTTNTSPMTIDLFTTGTAVTSQISIKSVKLYDISGELLEEVRPCTRDEDGAIGMYAMKSGIFGSNTISGGELIVGE